MRWFSLLVLFLTPLPAYAQSTDPTYWQDVRPIFRKHCTACHSAKHVRSVEVSGGLALDTFEATKKGSKQPVIAPGQSAKSLLYDLLITHDAKRRMPLDADPLSKDKVELVKKWIDSGAKEGTPPADVAVMPTKKAATRKLDVLLPTAATLPKAKGKADLALKIGPLAPVTAVAFSPNNKLLAVGSYGQVIVWDLNRAQPAKVLTNVLGAINDLKFSPDGSNLAVGGGQPSAKGDLRLYQATDWKLLATLRGHDDVVFSLAFSPDGKQLASASFDHSVRLWDVHTHATLKEFHNHSDFVYAVAFNPNGKQIVTASKDRTVQLVDLQSGKSLFTFSGMEQDVMAAAFHPDGKTIISSGFEPAIYWWNATTGEKIKTQGGHGIAVHELAFSRDGKLAVSAGADRTLRTWDSNAKTVVKVIPVGSVTYSVAISSSGKLLASGSFDGLTRIWDTASGRQLATLLGVAGEDGKADWLANTPEGYTVGSDHWVSLVRWRAGAMDLAAAPIWAALRQAPPIAQALRGNNVPAPKFDK